MVTITIFLSICIFPFYHVCQEREAERQKSGGGQVFYMREREDITGKDGRLVLFEFSEEHPLLMSCTGMASR